MVNVLRPIAAEVHVEVVHAALVDVQLAGLVVEQQLTAQTKIHGRFCVVTSE